MIDHKHKTPTKDEKDSAVNHLPGAAVDRADEDKVSDQLVEERTKTLNNNPRNQH